MIKQQELIDKCTPEIIKKMVEFAEGFEIYPDRILGQIESVSGAIFTLEYNNILNDSAAFPLLIHRAIEGWNNKNDIEIYIELSALYVTLYRDGVYRYKISDYRPTTLTHAECALLHCLLKVLK